MIDFYQSCGTKTNPSTDVRKQMYSTHEYRIMLGLCREAARTLFSSRNKSETSVYISCLFEQGKYYANVKGVDDYVGTEIESRGYSKGMYAFADLWNTLVDKINAQVLTIGTMQESETTREFQRQVNSLEGKSALCDSLLDDLFIYVRMETPLSDRGSADRKLLLTSEVAEEPIDIQPTDQEIRHSAMYAEDFINGSTLTLAKRIEAIPNKEKRLRFCTSIVLNFSREYDKQEFIRWADQFFRPKKK